MSFPRMAGLLLGLECCDQILSRRREFHVWGARIDKLAVHLSSLALLRQWFNLDVFDQHDAARIMGLNPDSTA
jgi:hypothetical protein